MKRRREGMREVEEVVKRVFAPHWLTRLPPDRLSVWNKISPRWKPAIKTLLSVCPATEGNRVSLFVDGDAAFEEQWKAIANARRHVWWAVYTISPDPVGFRSLAHLTKAKAAGCDVLLLYDAVGSSSMRSRHFVDLHKLDSDSTLEFNPVMHVKHLWKYWPPDVISIIKGAGFRLHHKMLIADDVAFIGSMNIGEEYGGVKSGGTGLFRDTTLKLEGPAVRDIQQVFLASLQEAADETEQAKRIMERVSKRIAEEERRNQQVFDDGVFVQVLQSNIRKEERKLQKAMRVALANATNNCYLTSPYFLPPRVLKRAILRAKKRGVDVRIMTAGYSDVPLVRSASQHIYSSFLKRGVKVYEMFGTKHHQRTLHAKTATIDGICSIVGSFNLDAWSHHGNMELVVATLDASLASQLETQFHEDLKLCKEVTLEEMEKRPIFDKLSSWLWYQFFTIFGPPSIPDDPNEGDDDEEDDDDDDDEDDRTTYPSTSQKASSGDRSTTPPFAPTRPVSRITSSFVSVFSSLPSSPLFVSASLVLSLQHSFKRYFAF